MIDIEDITLATEDGATAHGRLYLPPRSETAVTIMHPTTDWRSHYILPLLAERGFAAFGFATRYAAREAELILEETLLDMAAGVRLLRGRGFKRVVAIGNSGGGEIVAGYQAEAESPTLTCTALNTPPNLTTSDLPQLDGLILLNAHRGRPHSLTRGLDPSVGGEDGNDPFCYDAKLDMYNPRNGPPYSGEFREHYEAGQANRNHKITRWAQQKLKELSATGNHQMQDVPFIVHRTDANLAYLDHSLEPTERTGKTIWGEDPRIANYTVGALRGSSTRLRVFTLRSWISQRGLTTSHFDMLRFLPRCHVPLLFMIGTAEESTLPSEAKAMFDAAADPAKQYSEIKGATHFMRDQPEQQRQAADTISFWLRARDLA